MIRRSLRVNITANILGRAYTAAAGVIFVPIYLHFLGVADYGLFALLNSYMVIAALLDLGVSGAITRELAMLSSVSPQRMRDLVWTISVPYCAATFVIAIGIYVAAPWIAAAGVNTNHGQTDPTVIRAVGVAGFGLAFQLPMFLYSGGLAGIQRQDLANGIAVASTTLRHCVGFLLLWLFSASVVTLMAWQAVVGALTALTDFIVLWRLLPRGDRRPKFKVHLFKDTWRFAAGLGLLTAVWIVTYQSDKVMVGSLLPLIDVGHYMVASVIATNLMVISRAIADAAFPRLAQLLATRDWSATYVTFEKLMNLVALIVLPIAATIAIFPEEFLILWTGNRAVAQGSAPYLCYLAVGVACSAFASLPYALILATGRTRSLVVVSVVISAITIPAAYVATLLFGAAGAAAVVSTYLCLGLIAVGIVLRPTLSRRQWSRWLAADVMVPLIVVGSIALPLLMFAPHEFNRIGLLVLLAVAWFGMAIAAALAMPWTREQSLFYLQKMLTRLQLSF